jgi:hypothetical protein
MTKKHFIALADSVRNLDLTETQLDALARFCASQNPRFNYDRWMNYVRGACGPSGGKLKG